MQTPRATARRRGPRIRMRPAPGGPRFWGTAWRTHRRADGRTEARGCNKPAVDDPSLGLRTRVFGDQGFTGFQIQIRAQEQAQRQGLRPKLGANAEIHGVVAEIFGFDSEL